MVVPEPFENHSLAQFYLSPLASGKVVLRVFRTASPSQQLKRKEAIHLPKAFMATFLIIARKYRQSVCPPRGD
jgi:hypothetical protein